jgi:hypothetical protein
VEDTDRLYQAIGAVIPSFFCPTRRGPKPYTRNHGAQSACGQSASDLSGNQPAGMSDYAASYGSRSANPSSMSGATVRMACTVAPGLNGQPRKQGNRNTIGMEGIVDGTANVILYGEKRLNVKFLWTNKGDDNEGYTAGNDQDTSRWNDLKPLPDVLHNAPNTGESRFGASHPATFNVVMCDGAVKTISYRIESSDLNQWPTIDITTVPPTYLGNFTLFNKLGIRNDGMPAEIQ